MTPGLLPFFPAVFLSLAVGILIYYVIKPSGKAISATQVGRKWCAWSQAGSAIIFLPKILYMPVDIKTAVEYLGQWIVIGIFMYGFIAFCAGWLAGKLILRGKSVSDGQHDGLRDSHLP